MITEQEHEYTFKTNFLETLGTHQKMIQNNEALDYSYDSIDATNYKVHAGLFLQLPYDEDGDIVFLRDVARVRLKHMDDCAEEVDTVQLKQRECCTELSVWYFDGCMPGLWTLHYHSDELYLLKKALFAMYIGDP